MVADGRKSCGRQTSPAGLYQQRHPKHEGVYDLVERLLETALPCLLQAADIVKRNRTRTTTAIARPPGQRERRMPWGLPDDRSACQSSNSRRVVCTALTKECHLRQTSCSLSGTLTGRRRYDGVCRQVPLLNAQAAMKEGRASHDPSQAKAGKPAQDFLAIHPVVQPDPGSCSDSASIISGPGWARSCRSSCRSTTMSLPWRTRRTVRGWAVAH